MIKKSVFENDLINGMQRELRAHDQKQGFENLGHAVDYLHSAVQILEDFGMTAKADQLLKILAKIAIKQDTNVKEMPSMKTLMQHGVKMEDLNGIGKGDAFSKARVNTAFRRLGFTDKEIASFIGHHNLMSEEEAEEILSPERSFEKIREWIKEPARPIDPHNINTGETLKFDRLMSEKYKYLPTDQDIVFKSIAKEVDSLGKTVNDRHVKGLTVQKMENNLKDDGLMFNLVDDSFADDLLNVEVDHDLEISEHDPKETFEDSD